MILHWKSNEATWAFILVANDRWRNWNINEQQHVCHWQWSTERCNVLPSTVILRLKRDTDGRSLRFKARLAAMSSLQCIFDSIDDLYALVIGIELVRTLCKLCRQRIEAWGIWILKGHSCTHFPENEQVLLSFQHFRPIKTSQGTLCNCKCP